MAVPLTHSRLLLPRETCVLQFHWSTPVPALRLIANVSGRWRCERTPIGWKGAGVVCCQQRASLRRSSVRGLVRRRHFVRPFVIPALRAVSWKERMGDHYHRGGYPPGPPRDFRRDDRYYGHGPDHYGSPGGGFPPNSRPEPIKQEREPFFDRRPLDPGPPTHSMGLNTEIKQEEPDPGYRGPNASGPPQSLQNRKRPFEEKGRGFYEHRDDRRARSPQGRGADDEDDPFDENVVVLDNYNSDLHFKLSKDRTTGFPLTMEGFAYLWSGARATHGVNRGRVCFEIKIKEEIAVAHLPSSEPDPHVVRVGWSLDSCTTQLGEEPFSYGYGGTAKKSTNSKFENYGETFGENDVLGCFVDFETRGDIEISFSKNGQYLGTAFRVNRSTVGSQAFFPHILVKNCCVDFNFGQRVESFCNIPPGFTFIQHQPAYERIRGTSPPKNKGECEIVMMVGLPGAGKTTWAMKHSTENPEKKYNILGTNAIMEKMRVMGLRRQRNYAGRWDVLIQQATKCLNQLIQIASRRKRNYILDQTNVYGTAQRRKMRPFEGFQRKAVIICPTDADLLDRIVKRTDEEGKDVPDSAVLEMKANFSLPEAGDFLNEVVYIEVQKEEAEQLVRQYNIEGKKAGPPPEKKFRGRGGGPPGGGGGRGDGGRGDGGREEFQRFDNRGPPGGNRGGFLGRGGSGGPGFRGGGERGRGFVRGESRWSGGSQDNGSEHRGGFGHNSQQQSYSPGGTQGGIYGSGGLSSSLSQSAPSSYGQQSGFGGYGQSGGSGYSQGGSYGQGGGSGGGYSQAGGSSGGYNQGSGSSGGSSYNQGGGSSAGYGYGGGSTGTYDQSSGGGYGQGSGSSSSYNQGGGGGGGGSYSQTSGSGGGYNQGSSGGYTQGGGGSYNQSSGSGYGGQSYNSSTQGYGASQSYNQGYSQPPPQSSSSSNSSYNQGSYSQPYQQSYGGGQQLSQYTSQGQGQNPSPGQTQGQGQWNYGGGSYDQPGRYGGTQ